MRTAGDVKPGDKVIYKQGYSVVEATVVEKPIDDSYERPKFLIGRVDLDNGFYLTRGTYIYDSPEECRDVIIQELKDAIKKYEDEKTIADGMIVLLSNTLKRIREEYGRK